MKIGPNQLHVSIKQRENTELKTNKSNVRLTLNIFVIYYKCMINTCIGSPLNTIPRGSPVSLATLEKNNLNHSKSILIYSIIQNIILYIFVLEIIKGNYIDITTVYRCTKMLL